MQQHKFLKFLIWIYLALLIFEGSLRKWVLPGLSDPLLLIRDPLVVLIYIQAIREGVFPFNGWVISLGGVMVVSMVFFFLAGQTNPIVLALGLRTNYLHPPLIWVMGAVLTRKDLERMLAALLIVNIASTVLMAAQFNAPGLSVLNKGVGEGLGGALDGLGGKVRPNSFFSFTTGVGTFLPLVGAAAFAQLFARHKLWFPVFVGSAVCLILSLPLSINRTAMLATAGVFIVGIFCQLRAGLISVATIRLALSAIIVMGVLAATPIFKDAREAFMRRWDTSASDSRGGVQVAVIDRIIGGFTQPFVRMLDAPFFGEGIGIGSNMAARLMHGERRFTIAEDEWGKVFGELGPVLGLTFIGWRFALCFYLALAGMSRLQGARDPVSLLLFAAAWVPLLSGQWGQATALGFGVFGPGLAMAALNDYEEEEEDDDEEEEESDEDAGEDSEDAEDAEADDDDSEADAEAEEETDAPHHA